MALAPLGQATHTAIDHTKLRLKQLPGLFHGGDLSLFHRREQRRACQSRDPLFGPAFFGLRQKTGQALRAVATPPTPPCAHIVSQQISDLGLRGIGRAFEQAQETHAISHWGGFQAFFFPKQGFRAFCNLIGIVNPHGHLRTIG